MQRLVNNVQKSSRVSTLISTSGPGGCLLNAYPDVWKGDQVDPPVYVTGGKQPE